MALKEYIWRGHTWRFEESEAPEGAVPVTRPAAKSRRPAANKKAATPRDKGRAAAAKGA